MDFKSANELLDLCKKHDLPISEVMRQREIVEGEKEADTVHDLSLIHISEPTRH